MKMISRCSTFLALIPQLVQGVFCDSCWLDQRGVDWSKALFSKAIQENETSVRFSPENANH